ncbi:hypothetical protein Cyrtocomes_00394 [Candidatus Cyrtobacter comes]|uniref:Uncharacterized protein n=1 Tax=Candidatus Cyrtobacter comes TaxID=675776 RepID=A0ABU5L7D0_9RICK|nr:hypothetical protein [Candidatus Cyrtobacter comes]MDZ5762028.1 hypothetical protein [Candidatus Cyrtobacter comes]
MQQFALISNENSLKIAQNPSIAARIYLLLDKLYDAQQEQLATHINTNLNTASLFFLKDEYGLSFYHYIGAYILSNLMIEGRINMERDIFHEDLKKTAFKNLQMQYYTQTILTIRNI